MKITDLKEKKLILLECISGSKAYGLDTPQSDTDIRGVFFTPKNQFYSMEPSFQINNETNDESYYEIGKFFELMSKNNPTIIELLNTPKDSVLYKHPKLIEINKEFYLSKLCKNTFAGYAITQIKKARGLNKKILNPIEKDRKTVLDFCYVPHKQGSISVSEFLAQNNIKQENCGLAKLPHMHEIYGLYYSDNNIYKGIIQKETSNDIALSSIKKGEKPISIMSFNKSGYSVYCKEYKEYWKWVEKRNEARYENTLSHGKNYDAKNMMHTFRLLTMAEEIALYGEVIVKRNDREFLLGIKSGKFEYDDLLKLAEDKIQAMEEAYMKSQLPEFPDKEKLNELLVHLRQELYK